MNVASRMESTSLEGRIQVSQSTFTHTKNNFEFEERGTVDVKGKGAMLTYPIIIFSLFSITQVMVFFSLLVYKLGACMLLIVFVFLFLILTYKDICW